MTKPFVFFIHVCLRVWFTGLKSKTEASGELSGLALFLVSSSSPMSFALNNTRSRESYVATVQGIFAILCIDISKKTCLDISKMPCIDISKKLCL